MPWKYFSMRYTNILYKNITKLKAFAFSALSIWEAESNWKQFEWLNRILNSIVKFDNAIWGRPRSSCHMPPPSSNACGCKKMFFFHLQKRYYCFYLWQSDVIQPLSSLSSRKWSFNDYCFSLVPARATFSIPDFFNHKERKLLTSDEHVKNSQVFSHSLLAFFAPHDLFLTLSGFNRYKFPLHKEFVRKHFIERRRNESASMSGKKRMRKAKENSLSCHKTLIMQNYVQIKIISRRRKFFNFVPSEVKRASMEGGRDIKSKF